MAIREASMVSEAEYRDTLSTNNKRAGTLPSNERIPSASADGVICRPIALVAGH